MPGRDGEEEGGGGGRIFVDVVELSFAGGRGRGDLRRRFSNSPRSRPRPCCSPLQFPNAHSNVVKCRARALERESLEESAPHGAPGRPV